MELPEEYIRYSPVEVEKRLSERMGLPWFDGMQDWDLISSDSGRIKEFLSPYKTGNLNDDEKFAMMELIVSSFDDLAREKGSLHHNDLWQDCKNILINECWLHISTIHYWSSLEDNHPEDGFPSTKFIRPVWNTVKTNFI
ncbi:MAG: hypothetical protein AAF600_20350 [Bacteroidota bacterium]